MSKQEIIESLYEGLNGLSMGWMMANVRDDEKRNELQAPDQRRQRRSPEGARGTGGAVMTAYQSVAAEGGASPVGEPQSPAGSRASRLNLLNVRFGRLIVVNREPNDRHGNARWLTQCDCGGVLVVTARRLRQGETKSCGCLRRETAAASLRTHGLSGTPEYRVWCWMIDRCGRPTNQAFKNYGARGISVCHRWQDSFEAFLSDMGPRPSARHSIDRVNNDGNYEPGNCRWATRKVQNNNSRHNNNVLYRNQRITITQAAAMAGSVVDGRTAARRILKFGWSVERAVMTPASYRHQKKQKNV